MLRCLLFATLVAAPAVQVQVDAAEIDADATRRGLEVRLGEAVDGWVVEVRPTDTHEQVYLRLRSPSGVEVHRAITLEGEGVEERSRELASAVALIIEGHIDATMPAEDVGQPTQPEPLRGWFAVGPRLGAGPPSAVDIDGGLGVRGGVWLLGEHVQPIASLGWSRSRDETLVLDGVRLGAGAAFGTPLAQRRLWTGAGIVPHAAWTRARDRRDVSQWRSSTEVSALLQVRGSWWLLAARAGLDLTLPPVRARGQDTTLRWGPVRFMAGLEFGLVLPPGRR